MIINRHFTQQTKLQFIISIISHILHQFTNVSDYFIHIYLLFSSISTLRTDFALLSHTTFLLVCMVIFFPDFLIISIFFELFIHNCHSFVDLSFIILIFMASSQTLKKNFLRMFFFVPFSLS